MLPSPPSTTDALRAALSGAPLSGSSLTGILAFGSIQGKGSARTYRWFCCRFDKGTLAEITETTEAVDQITARDDISVAMALPEQDWVQLAEEAVDFPRLIEEKSPHLSGHLAFFIRHLPAVVEAARRASPALAL